MRTAKLYLPLILLVLASLVLAIKTVQVYKDKEIILSQIQVKGAVDTQPVKAMTDTDLITARQMIEGYAALYALPVEVKLVKREIRINIAKPTQEEGETGVTVEQESEKAKNRYAVLENYDNVMGFFTSLANMPYALDYKDFCVGVDCPNVFDVTIMAKNAQAGEQPPAKPKGPAKAESAPAPAPAS